MSRNQKIYKRFDTLIADFHAKLIREFEAEKFGTQSDYLCKKRRRAIDKGRANRMTGIFPFKEANDLLAVEKEILSLCQKLNEPLPLTIRLIEHYITEYENFQIGRPEWDNQVSEADHTRLRQQILEQLQ